MSGVAASELPLAPGAWTRRFPLARIIPKPGVYSDEGGQIAHMNAIADGALIQRCGPTWFDNPAVLTIPFKPGASPKAR